MHDLDREDYLARRLRSHGGPDVFDGITTRELRAKRFREAIERLGLQSVIVGSNAGKPATWAETLDAVYPQ